MDPAKQKERTDTAREVYQTCTQALKAGDAAARDALAQMTLLAAPPINAGEEIGQFMKALTLNFRQAQMEWLQARNNTHKVVKALQGELRDEPEFNRLDSEIGKLDTIVQGLDEKLETKLLEAIQEANYDKTLLLKSEALAQVKSYRETAKKNPYLWKMDIIPGRAMTVFADLMKHLSTLHDSLS